MSLWYDIKNKVYSSGPMDNWYVSYLQNCCKTLTNAVTSIFTNHSNGLTGRHKYEDIDCDNGINLRTLFENTVKDQNNALSLKVDKETGKQLSSNDYTDEDKLALSKTAGRKTDGNTFYYTYRLPNGESYLVPSNESCGVGSEVFNDCSSNQAKAPYSHAEGQYTSACGYHSHAEGIFTKTEGMCSHAEGENTIAAGRHQHVDGILNIEDSASKYIHIAGNGYYEIDNEYNETPVRSNAYTLDWQGNAWYAGDVICGNSKTGLQAQITDLYNSRPSVLTEVSEALTLNTIYDLGQCETLSLNIPDGDVGDWIKVDFISGESPTELSIITDNISDFNVIPEPNTAYTLIFDWGKLTADTYGWRFSYSEYTKVV